VGSSSVENATEMVDYVMFQRKRIQYDDQNGSAYYGLNIPNNKVAMEKNTDRVYINMPQNLSTQYGPTYRLATLGVAGMALSQGLNTAGKFDEQAEALQKAAKDAMPEFAMGAMSEIAQGAANFLGLAGNASPNDIMALSKGKVFNPYQEQLFSNMQFRNHMFSFKFFARNDRESREINNIIKYLKQGALPIYGTVTDGGDAGTGSARFFEIPDKFDIKFVRLDPESGTLNSSADLHHKIHTSVCTGIDVNYTPDGQYNAIKNAQLGVGDNAPLQVPAVTLNCRFTETQLVMQSNITEGY